ncbi:hypothetical protein CTAYLR_002838 [Chrysophaeum taylorii]|uniref:CAF1B/HIR1 beta-propeller domain-containing protein n=1 Tax=Chrysophaeum taylorii TaxID=2483200 RepID=A0AAD7XJ14_9STRA|nr:hypothetical protein CTAYLR_002838 [Chrysophaeum taylorii]
MRVEVPMISYHSSEDGKSDRIMAVDCHPDASETSVTFLTVGGGGGEGDVRIWHVAEGQSPRYCSSLRKGHDGSVNCGRWAPEGSRVASAGDRGAVCVWSGGSSASWWRSLDENDERATCSKLAHADDVYDVAWSPCGEYLLTGAIDHTAALWHVGTKRRVRVISDHAHYVQGVAFDPRGECFATQSSDKTVRVYDEDWKKAAGKVLKFWDSDDKRHAVFANELQHAGFFRRLGFATDGELLVAPAALAAPGWEDHKTGAVAFARGEAARGPCAYYPAPDGQASVVKASPVLFDAGTRSLFALAFRDAVAVYDVAAPNPLLLVRGLHRAALTDLAWSNDASMLVVASGDGYLSFLKFSPDDLGRPDPPSRKLNIARGPPADPTPEPSPAKQITMLVAREKPELEDYETFDQLPASTPVKKKYSQPIDLAGDDDHHHHRAAAAAAAENVRLGDHHTNGQPARGSNNKKKRRIAPTLVADAA